MRTAVDGHETESTAAEDMTEGSQGTDENKAIEPGK